MSGGCIHTPVHKYDCWNHGNGTCVEKGEDICSGCLSIARADAAQLRAAMERLLEFVELQHGPDYNVPLYEFCRRALAGSEK